MTLTKKFNLAVNQWRRHVAHGIGPSGIPVLLSSMSDDVYECEPCRRIVSMGVEALPLIRKLYDTKKDFPLEVIQGHGLLAAVSQIAGSEDFQIPEEIAGRIKKMEDYTKKWLDDNMYKYVVTDKS